MRHHWTGAFLLTLAGLAAHPPLQSAEDVRRDVLLVHNARQAGFADPARHHASVAQTPLEHLGLRAIPHDWSRRGPPGSHATSVARGALVWFRGSTLDDPQRFLRWAIDFMRRGRHLVLAGDLAFLLDRLGEPVEPVLLDAFFELLGVDFDRRRLDDFEPLRITTLDRSVMEHEKPIGDNLASVPRFTVTPPAGDVFLRLSDAAGHHSDVVARTRGGGLLHAAYGHAHFADIDRGYWLTDPIEFFRAAFRTGGVPVADTTTLTGRRLYLGHVAGTGWNTTSAVANQRGVRRIAAHVVLDRLVAPYPDLPVSIAPVPAELDPETYGTPAGIEAARALFALPNVEPAIQSYSHPFDWSYFHPRHYDSRHERMLPYDRTPGAGRLRRWIGSLVDTLRPSADHGSVYERAGRRLPRAYYTGPFDLRLEIDEAIARVEGLAPPGKPVRLMVWTGDDPMPFEAALRRVREHGLANIGGGQTRLDPTFASLSYVSPSAVAVGEELQVNSAMSGDAHYTRRWPERYFGFQNLLGTIARTERPVRLRPVHVSYELRALEQHSTLRDIVTVLDRVREMPLHPIAVSHYASIVDGARRTRIRRRPGGWSVLDRGAVDTLRLDGGMSWNIDLAASRGVLGHVDVRGSRYVALDPAVREVFLARALATTTPSLPALIDSRWAISHVSRDRESATFRLEGYGAGTMRWRFRERCEGRFTSTGPTGVVHELPIRSDQRGRVTVALDGPPSPGTRGTLTCRGVGT